MGLADLHLFTWDWVGVCVVGGCGGVLVGCGLRGEGCRVGVVAWGGGGVSLFELGWWEGLMGEGNMHITGENPRHVYLGGARALQGQISGTQGG